MAELDVGRLVGATGVNAAIGWVLAAVMALAVVGAVFQGEFLWAGFAIGLLVIVLVPPIHRWNPRVMLPWEVLALAGLPVLGRSIVPIPAGGDFATYLAVAALALVVAVELHLYTTVKMSAGFAVLFVVIATMAVAGVWAVARWVSDLYLNTDLLLVPGRSEHDIERGLMIEFLVSTVVGVAAGLFFEVYVRRRAGLADRLEEVERS